jgi:hypothetical protein
MVSVSRTGCSFFGVVENVANYCNDERAGRESTRRIHAELVLADGERISR